MLVDRKHILKIAELCQREAANLTRRGDAYSAHQAALWTRDALAWQALAEKENQ